MGWWTFLKQDGTTVPTPTTGKSSLYVDSTSGEPSYKDDAGTVHTLVGADGTGIQLSGRVATYADLPAGLTSGDAGKAYIVDADDLMYVWSGTAFPASGAGLSLGGLSNPMTAAGDLIIGGTSGTPARLAGGADTYVLTRVAGATQWAAPGAAAVTSVFGRTGAVTAQSGDYTPSDVGAEPAITAGTTAQYRRGDKTWADFATDVRAAVLTGLSTATNATITAADTVLAALGKLQAQISANVTAIAAKAGTAVANVFTAQQSTTPARGTMTGTVALNLANLAASTGITWTGTPPVSSNKLILTLTGNVTLSTSGAADGASYAISLLQDATGNRTLSLSSKFKVSGGAPTLSTAAGARDKLCCDYDGAADLFECAFMAVA